MSSRIKNEVFWYSDLLPIGAPLRARVSADVVIIGAGMTGLMAAQLLCQQGKSVVIVERDFCGAGASGKTSGFITPDSEVELSALLKTYGLEQAKNIWEFVVSGVEHIRRNIVDHQIACDYQVQDSLFVANRESASKYPYHEHEARQRLHYESHFYRGEKLHALVGSKKYTAAVRYPDTFGMNSYHYCQGLKDILLNNGVRIYEKTPAITIHAGGITTTDGSVDAHHVIVATDRFIPELGKLKNEMYHIQTFLGISQPLGEDAVRTLFPEKKMMVWDTDLVYNYFRVTGDNRILIGGGDVWHAYARGHATNMHPFAERLQSYLHTQFPSLAFELEYVWPGMLGVSKDLLPIMGPDEQYSNVWYVGAATGLPWAAALGRYAAERILNGRNDFDLTFSPERKFVIGPKLQRMMGTPLAHALSHGISKL